MDNMPLDITVLGVKVTDVPYRIEVTVDENEVPQNDPTIIIDEETKIRCRTLAVMAKRKKLKEVKYA